MDFRPCMSVHTLVGCPSQGACNDIANCTVPWPFSAFFARLRKGWISFALYLVRDGEPRRLV
ncbi:MAG: hypothetical protein CMM07_08080 [Rhodopirellula sp.]|nr:hypothetical protein [Rhodopirellula sp.]